MRWSTAVWGVGWTVGSGQCSQSALPAQAEAARRLRFVAQAPSDERYWVRAVYIEAVLRANW